MRISAPVEVDREAIVEVEPENVDAVRLFFALQTQWRMEQLTGASGKNTVNVLVRTGLDYGVLPGICTALCITPDEALLGALRTLEAETLRIEGERRQKLFSAR